MRCPVCKTVLIVVEQRGVEIDYCVSCAGVWLDSGELEVLLEIEHACATPGDSPILTPMRAKSTRRLRCPDCGTVMSRFSSGIDSVINIDGCARKHGFWFDAGELDAVVAYSGPDSGHAAVAGFLKDLFKASPTEGHS